MRNFKKMIEKMVEDQRRWQDQLDRFLEPQRRVQEQIDRALEPQRRVQEQIDRALEPQRRVQEQLDRFRERLASQMQAHHSMASVMVKAIQSQKTMADQIAKQALRAQHFTWVSEVQKHWTAHADIYFSGLAPDAINVTPSGDIVLGRETVTSEDFAKNLTLLNKKLATVSTPIDYFRCIFSFLSRLSKPLARILFVFLSTYMIGVLVNLTTPIYEPWWKELTGQSKEEVASKIRENALNRYDPPQLKDHRFVTANRLQVRAGPSKEKKVLGALPRGKLVRIIRANQHWTKVEYFDEGQQKIRRQGWVATSHLGKLTK